MNQINSQASMAGRYGSGAMADLQDRATSQFASALTDTAGQLAYDNYARERQNQLAQTQLAPSMAAQDYADIDRMLQLGQVSEGYQQLALKDAIDRFNFAQKFATSKTTTIPSRRMRRTYGTDGDNPCLRTNPIAGALGGGLAGSTVTDNFH